MRAGKPSPSSLQPSPRCPLIKQMNEGGRRGFLVLWAVALPPRGHQRGVRCAPGSFLAAEADVGQSCRCPRSAVRSCGPQDLGRCPRSAVTSCGPQDRGDPEKEIRTCRRVRNARPRGRDGAWSREDEGQGPQGALGRSERGQERRRKGRPGRAGEGSREERDVGAGGEPRRTGGVGGGLTSGCD